MLHSCVHLFVFVKQLDALKLASLIKLLHHRLFDSYYKLGNKNHVAYEYFHLNYEFNAVPWNYFPRLSTQIQNKKNSFCAKNELRII